MPMETIYADGGGIQSSCDCLQLTTGGRQVEKLVTDRGLSPMTPLNSKGDSGFIKLTLQEQTFFLIRVKLFLF